MGDESSASWKNPLAYVGGQFALLLGFWFVVLAMAARRFWRSADPGIQLVWWASVPVWGVFFVASFGTPGQANWPAAAYIGGIVLVAAWMRDALGRSRTIRNCLIAALACGIVISIAIRFPQFARPMLAQLAGEPNEANPTPVRRLDPTCRLHGWQTLAQEIDSLRDDIHRETGEEPLLAAMTWTVPGELCFYCRNHPEAYSFGPALADRHSQYDLWHPNPVADPHRFRGRTFIYVGDEIPGADRVFDRVDPPIPVVHQEGGIPVARWTIWVCRGFRGFPARPVRAGY
jgi:hypothetical protein